VPKDDKNTFPYCKKLYRDIIFGYSEKRLKDSSKIFIKHFTELEAGVSEKRYDDFLFLAESKGLKNQKDALKFVIEHGLWSQEKEDRFNSLSEQLTTLKQTKAKLIIKSQIEPLQKEIKPLEDESYLLFRERTENIGHTAEVFASKKINELCVQQACFLDESLKEPFHSEEDFDLLEQGEVNIMANLYSSMGEDFYPEQVKRIAISPFFMNTYFLCKDNVLAYFGKPILELTNFQISLMSSAKHIKNLISNSSKSAPEGYYETPDKLIEWYELQDKTRGARDSMEKKGDAGGRTIVGANKEEIESIESDGEQVLDLNKIAQERGELDFEEIIKLHGM
jgi:hypothetical protein